MVFGWQRSSSKQSNDSKLARAAITASATGAATPRTSISCNNNGRHQSSLIRTNPPCASPMAVVVTPIAEDGCEVVPQFFPGYQTSPTASIHGLHAGGGAQVGNKLLNSPAETYQRRAGSVNLSSLAALPGNQMQDRHEPRSETGFHEGNIGPRRSSNGSTFSTTSTLSPKRQTPHCLPVLSPTNNGAMHTPGGYYHTKTAQWPLLDERANSQYAPPCIPVSTTAIRSTDSHASCYQLGQYQQQQQRYEYQYQYPQLITPPLGHISGNHRLSATVCYQQGPESAPHCPKKYYPVSSTTAAYMEEERPGSYSQRRRGGSVSGNGSNGSSTVNSPTLLKTHGDYYQTEAPAHQLHQKCGWYASSTLQRNNTTKTVTQNDLDADCKALGTRGRQDRRLSTPRSISYGRQLPQGHAYYTPLSLPATPEGEDVANTPEVRYHRYSPPLPLAQGDMRSSISSMTTIAASADKAGIKRYDTTDDMHILNGLTPSVNKPGNQYAYLPPRSKNLAVTN